MKLHMLQNTTSFGRRKRLIERRRRMCVQVILHQTKIINVRIDLIDQPTHDLGIVLHSALYGHFHMPPGSEFIFLSSWWMVLGEIFSTKPSSTALLASKRTVQ